MTVLSRLRRTHPYLTPPWAGEDNEVPPILLPRIGPVRLGGPSIGRGEDIVPISELPIERSEDRWLRTPPVAPTALDAVGEPPPVPLLTRRTADSPAAPLIDPNLLESLARQPDTGQVAVGDAPPMVLRRNGRPTQQFIGGGTPEERLLTRRQALESYQPQKESKKHLLLRTALGFIGGGLAGPGGVAQTLLGPGGVLDRRGVDRAWQQEELARADEQYGRLRTDRRAGLQDRLLEAQVKKAEAPTVPPLRNVQLGSAVLNDGRTVQMERTETGWKVSTGSDGQPIVTKPAPANKPKVTVEVPGFGPIEVTPEAALGYYGTSENRNFQREQKAGEASFTNTQVDAGIQSTQQQLSKVGEALANTAEWVPRVNAYGETVQEPNPRYTDLKNEQQALQKELRDWQAKRVAPPTLTRSSTYTGRTMTKTNLARYAKDNGLTEEAARREVEGRGITIR